jgi:Zn finger protein HypA/HybF involved in hydrogenase expression
MAHLIRKGQITAEIEQEVKTFTVYYLCDECGKGRMEPTGICLTSNPLQWPHKCNKCGSEKTFKVKYPRTIYRNGP